jgi:hypothetical protein
VQLGLDTRPHVQLGAALAFRPRRSRSGPPQSGSLRLSRAADAISGDWDAACSASEPLSSVLALEPLCCCWRACMSGSVPIQIVRTNTALGGCARGLWGALTQLQRPAPICAGRPSQVCTSAPIVHSWSPLHARRVCTISPGQGWIVEPSFTARVRRPQLQAQKDGEQLALHAPAL